MDFNFLSVTSYTYYSLSKGACVGKKTKSPDLEESLAKISELIEKMEQEELSLEQSLDCFEKGITLIKHSQKILQAAEQKVQLLIQNANDAELITYENQEE